MAKAARSADLRAAFEKHQRETEVQVQRLEKVFQLIEEPAKGKKCAAIEGIIEEGKEIILDYKGSPALDAGLLAGAQAVEHYEISRYGTLKAWAEKLEIEQAVRLLDQTLTEEKDTDEALTELAEAAIEPRRRKRPSRKSAVQPPKTKPRLPGVLVRNAAHHFWESYQAVDILSDLILRQSVPLLDSSLELIPLTGDLVQVVIGEITPLLFDFSLELLPISFDSVPVHVCAPYVRIVAEARPRMVSRSSFGCFLQSAPQRRAHSLVPNLLTGPFPAPPK